MDKNVLISEALYALAQSEASSIDQQVKHRAKLGLAATPHGKRSAVTSSNDAFAMTRELDALDVLSGKRSADHLHFIPRAVARQSRAVFPSRYRRS